MDRETVRTPSTAAKEPFAEPEGRRYLRALRKGEGRGPSAFQAQITLPLLEKTVRRGD